MPITIEPVHSQKDLFRYVQFAWKIYKDDQAWVPPLINDMVSRLDPAKNPFWKTATRMLWIAYKDGQPAGTITAIYDRHLCQVLNQKVGTFGFFECIHDQGVADLLFSTAADWLCLQGMTVMRGPYNPGPSDEVGILTEGFEIRPTVMTGHHPPYYASLLENGGFERHWQCVARMLSIPPDCKTIEEFVQEQNEIVKLRQSFAVVTQQLEQILHNFESGKK
jgi:hypothetical protein